MAFYSDDLYALSAGATIFNYWQPFVTKHDTSSFYNWEQDNLPLYDLEERTDYLWEKFGYPLSAVPSIALLVSSTVPTDTALSCNVFTSVSAAIEALPEIIRMPILIEVALSGDMGTLELDNIKCVEDGLLEIVNRGFAPIRTKEGSKYRTNGAESNTYYFPSGVYAEGSLDTIDNTSALQFSANTSNLFPAVGVAGYTRSFVQTTLSAVAGTVSNPSYAWPGAGDSIVFRYTDNNINISPIAISTFAPSHEYDDSTITSQDLSTISQITGNIVKNSQPQDEQGISGWVTANSLSKLKITNSDGPIFVRGFIVDGLNANATTGIEVSNSEGVTLEYVGAMRSFNVGAHIINSKVNLRRGFCSLRNYDTGNRDASSTYGLLLDNSLVKLETDSYTSGLDFTFNVQHHTYGVALYNSRLFGGEGLASETSYNTQSIVNVNYNDVGILVSNSEIDLKGILATINNGKGIHAISSNLLVERLFVENSQDVGVHLVSSKFRYNNSKSDAIGVITSKILSEDLLYLYPIQMDRNGQHLILEGGSDYGPTFTADNPSSYAKGEVYFATHGANLSSTDAVSLPAILVDNSKATFFAGKFITSGIATGSEIKGSLLCANNSSEVSIRGTGGGAHAATIFEGGPSFNTQKKTALVAALNNSTVYIHGPTLMYNTGVGILSEGQSNVIVSPHLDENNDVIDVSSWAATNYLSNTCLEIHATRSCVVANQGSTIKFNDLGYYKAFWPTTLGNLYDDPDYDPVYGNDVSAGALQFYPNPFDSNFTSNYRNSSFTRTFSPTNPNQGLITRDTDLSCLRMAYSNGAGTGQYDNATHEDDIREFSKGGNCVRATKGSTIIVNNVHFPTGFYNPDATFFDPSASIAGCNDLRMWNISNDSNLYASYCTVSGTFPSQTGYTGPRSTYASGTFGQGEDSSAVAYGVASAADTSNISVLDHFGSGVEVSAGHLSTFMSALGNIRTGTEDTYGPNSYENRGPFRIFFGVPPVVKHFGYIQGGTASSLDNVPMHHISQGYLLSGNVSAAPELSSVYPDMLRYDSAVGSLVTSGYYFPSSLGVDVAPGRVLLDESAAETFANAKNASITYSGRNKLLHIYRSTDSVVGEGHSPDPTDAGQVGHGVGLKSVNIFDLGREV